MVQIIPSDASPSAGLEVHGSWTSNPARDTWTDLSVLICAVLVMKCCMAQHQPITKHGKGAFVMLVGVWYWTTTTWAAETKGILAAFQSDHSEPGFPLLGFWLTFMPQVMSAIVFAVGLYFRSGPSSAKKLLFMPSRQGGTFWLVAGAGYWYGQFFTVQSLVFGSAALTFCVKAAEPLSTALLAVVVLRNAFSFRLVLGIFVACLGIMLTVLSTAPPEGGTNHGAHGQLAALVFGVLGNLGFSSRACVAKKALLQKQTDAMETLGIMTALGAQTGLLPIIAFASVSHLGILPSALLPFLDPRFSARGWFMMCLSYTLYQTCSVLVLSAVAVESHALLVAMKHLLVAVFVSIIVHTQLTGGVIVGMAMTLFGVYLYMGSAKANGAEVNEDLSEARPTEAEAEATAILLPAQNKSTIWHVPALLQGIICVVVVLGTVTPSTFAALGLSRAADL